MLVQADIDQHWHRIEPVLRAEFQAGSPDAIVAACRLGRAQLYVADDGFAVVAPEVDMDSGRTELLVWFAHGDSFGAMKRNQADLVEIARAGGYSALTAKIWHRGLIRMMPRMGWKARHIEVVLEINHG